MTSAERAILDASAAIAMLRAEPEAAEVARFLATRAGDGAIVVPDHFWLEVQNVLVRRYRWQSDAVVEAFRLLDELGIVTVPLDRPILLLALEHMTTSGLTAYDAAYLALAEVEDAPLVTLDEELAAAAQGRALVPGRRGTLEPRAADETAATDWRAHGRYLAGLRAQAAAT